MPVRCSDWNCRSACLSLPEAPCEWPRACRISSKGPIRWWKKVILERLGIIHRYPVINISVYQVAENFSCRFLVGLFKVEASVIGSKDFYGNHPVFYLLFKGSGQRFLKIIK